MALCVCDYVVGAGEVSGGCYAVKAWGISVNVYADVVSGGGAEYASWVCGEYEYAAVAKSEYAVSEYVE